MYYLQCETIYLIIIYNYLLFTNGIGLTLNFILLYEFS